jgi:hypothetical protein
MTTPVAPEESGNPRDGDAAEASIEVRELAASDSDAIVGLLTRGFRGRSPKYWRRALPGDYPRFGSGLTDSRVLVGILLLIFSRAHDGSIRANVSSWYVEPKNRLYSNLLLARALKRSDVTFVNISPARHTLMTIEAQGFVRYVEGTMLTLAALCPFRPAAEITRVAPSFAKDASVVARHAALGCLTDEGAYRGEIHPFVFLPRLSHRSGVKFVQLVDCRDVADYVRFAGPLGRTLLRIGFFLVILDAVGRAKELPGRYLAGQIVKHCRGPAKPRLCDLRESEIVWYGP